ncbi:MAG: hypothetical protein GF313_05995, partial [Caldithrix sp.]|nr:hypothetical protein [Caldithrix sp.]
EYVAGEYVFKDAGKTITALANSVNVLQDVWANRYFGLIPMGLRAGEWLNLQNKLELHVIGDPTFRFGPKKPIEPTIPGVQLVNEDMLDRWLEKEPAALQLLGIRKLYETEQEDALDVLEAIYRQSASANVRLEALAWLAESRSDIFYNILETSVNDPNELIRRLTVKWMGESGRHHYLPALAYARVHDVSERVRFNAKNSLAFIDPGKALGHLSDVWSQLENDYHKQNIKYIINSMERSREWLNEEIIPALRDTSTISKDRYAACRTLRNYHFHKAVPVLLQVLNDDHQEMQLRINAAEALGWFQYSLHRSLIIERCSQILKKQQVPQALADEIMKTKLRLTMGPNNSITP